MFGFAFEDDLRKMCLAIRNIFLLKVILDRKPKKNINTIDVFN